MAEAHSWLKEKPLFWTELQALASDHTLQTIVLGTGFLGIVSGMLGCFAVLRKQSLLGDAMSHAALPGIALAFLITQTKHPVILLLGAIAAGWIGTIVMSLVSAHTKLKEDAALGIILSVFFGFGLVLLTFIQRLPTANKSGLNTYLFGNAATLLKQDVNTMLIMGGIAIICLGLFWKEFKLLTFDPDYGIALGFPHRKLDIFLTTITVFAIVIGLQTVGVVLMSALIIAPGAAARQWTDKLYGMVLIAAAIGAASGITGSIISSLVAKLPTGPTIVLVLSVFVLISLLFAPNRGLIISQIRHNHNQKKIAADRLLANLLLFSESQTDPFHMHDIAALKAIGRGGVTEVLQKLESQDLVTHRDKVFWGLTQKGLERAQQIQKELSA